MKQRWVLRLLKGMLNVLAVLHGLGILIMCISLIAALSGEVALAVKNACLSSRISFFPGY